MSPYVFKGKVHEVGKLLTFQSGFAKRSLVLVEDPNAQYKNYAVFDFLKTKNGDGTQELNRLVEGMTVEVKFYTQANESKKNPGSWFCSNRGVELKVVGEQVEIPTSQKSVPPPAEPPASVSMDDDPDDFPF